MSLRLRPSGLLAAVARGRRTLAAGLAALALLASGAAAAQVTSFTETVLAAYTFNNPSDPFAGNPECTLQTGVHTYSARTIVATVTGPHTFTMSAATGLGDASGTGTDPWSAIFSGDFNPAAPTAGLINCDDDASNGVVRTPSLTVNLVAGQRYTLVTSNWQTGIHPGTATYQVTQPIALAGPALIDYLITSVGFNSATAQISSNANGTLAWTVQLASLPAPSTAQVLAGQAGNGTPAFASGTNAITSGSPYNLVASGLQPSTQYSVHAVVTDRQAPPQTNATPVSSGFTTLSALPGAPTGASASATANVGEVLVSFTPPVYEGAGAISAYTVTSAPDGITATGAGSPILVTGLTGGTPYTFTVTATNVAGEGAPSAPSNAATPLSAPVLGAFADQVVTFGDASFDLVAPTSTSPGAFSFSIDDPAVATVSGSTVTIVGIGTATITASQAAAPGYVAASTTAQITVNPAAPVISWAPGLVMTYGDPAQALPTPTSNSGGAFTYASGDASVASVSGNQVAPVNVGSTVLTATQAAFGNYTAGSVQMPVQVLPATPVLAWISDFSRTYGDAAFPLTPPTGPSDGAFTYASSDASVATVAGNVVTITGAGIVTLTATQAPSSDGNYAGASISVVMTVDKAAPAISWVALLQRTWGEPAFALPPVDTNSTGAITYASADTNVATVSGNVVTMLNIGSTTITATQAADANFLAAEVSLVLEVGAATPGLTWVGDISKTYGEPAFDLPNPASPSPGAFTFTSADASVATVSGRTVTIVGPGTTVLTATQAASGNWGGATVTTTLLVNARPDPTQDPTVVGLLQAQVDQAVRFANAQQGNIRDRLRQQRDADGNRDQHAMALQVLGGDGQALSLNAGPGSSSGSVLGEGWGLWSAGSVTVGQRDATASAQGFDIRSDGLTVGVDRRFDNGVLAGVALGYGWGESPLDDGRSRLEGEQLSLAAYGLWRFDRMFLDGLLGWGQLDFDIARYSAVADATGTARREGDQWFGSLTLGWELGSSLVGYSRFDASRSTLDAYREQGLGIYDLAYTRQHVDQSTLAAGIEGRHAWETSSGVVRPYWSLEYRRALENRSNVGINYVVLPQANDYVLGLRSFADDGFALGLGLDVEITSNWALGLMGRFERANDIGETSSVGLQLSWKPSGSAQGAASAGKR